MEALRSKSRQHWIPSQFNFIHNSDITRTFHAHYKTSIFGENRHHKQCTQDISNNSHKLHDRPIEMIEFTNCESPNQAATDQRVIFVMKGEISSVECCLKRMRTSPF